MELTQVPLVALTKVSLRVRDLMVLVMLTEEEKCVSMGRDGAMKPNAIEQLKTDAKHLKAVIL